MSTDANRDSLIGEVLASRYRIEAMIGEGAMGAVYRARHVKVGRAFAIKVLHPRFSGEERTTKRFAREAEVAGTLHHANVVSVVDVGDLPDGRRFLVMEHAEGITLLDLINETAPMSPARVISLVRQLCSGLQHAHELGLIHRDFKPDNVIVERDRHGNETPRIVDFGTAILREDTESSTERLTTKGLVLGTPHYMSPEHATGQPIDHRIDLFALGVTCFEMLTGHSPFEGDGVDVARANLLQETPVMNVRVPGLMVDPLLEAFTRKLMMKARDERPETAADARALIELIDHDRPAAAAALGVALPELRPPMVPSQLVTQPIPIEVDLGEMPMAAGAPPGMAWSAGAMMPPGAVPGTVPPWQGQVPWPAQPYGAPPQQAWQPGVRAPSSPPYSDAGYPRFRAQPEATEQIAQMRPMPWRLIIPGFAALAVLVTMVIAVRGHGEARPPANRVDYASLGAAAGSPEPTAPRAAAPMRLEPAANPAPAPAAVAPAAIAAAPAAPASPAIAPTPPVVARPVRVAPAPARVESTDTATTRPAPTAAARTAALSPPPATHPITMPLSANGVAELYASVGRQLKALDATRGASATANLWPLYLTIHINEVMQDPSKLADVSAMLYRLEDQVSRRSAVH